MNILIICISLQITTKNKMYFIPFYDDELKQQYYVVQLEQELAKGTAELEIEWTGDLTGTLVGINKVTYTDGGTYIIHLRLLASNMKTS